MKRTTVVTAWVALVALAGSFAGAPGALAAPTKKSWTINPSGQEGQGVGVTVIATSTEVAGALLEMYGEYFLTGQVVIGGNLPPNPDATSAVAGLGAVTITQISSGKYVTIPGIGTAGTVTVVGSDGQSRTGNEVMAAAGIAYPADPLNPEASFQWAGGIITQITVKLGALDPSLIDSQSEAEAIWDGVYSNFARRGMTFSKTLYNRKTAVPVAFYFTSSMPLTLPGTVTGATGAQSAWAVGMINIKGEWAAIATLGAGALGNYVQ